MTGHLCKMMRVRLIAPFAAWVDTINRTRAQHRLVKACTRRMLHETTWRAFSGWLSLARKLREGRGVALGYARKMTRMSLWQQFLSWRSEAKRQQNVRKIARDRIAILQNRGKHKSTMRPFLAWHKAMMHKLGMRKRLARAFVALTAGTRRRTWLCWLALVENQKLDNTYAIRGYRITQRKRILQILSHWHNFAESRTLHSKRARTLRHGQVLI